MKEILDERLITITNEQIGRAPKVQRAKQLGRRPKVWKTEKNEKL